MKKTAIAFLLVLILSVFSVYALDGLSFSAGVGYDIRTVKQLGDHSNSLDVELGIKFPIGDGFSVYTDAGFRFLGKASFNGRPSSKSLFGVNIRAGIVYGMRFVKNPSFETYLGGGITYGTTKDNIEASEFYNIGIGFKIVAAYRFNDSIALTLTEEPEIYILNRGQFKFGAGNNVAIGTMFKF